MENLKNFNDEQEGNRKKEEEKYDTSRPYGSASDMMRDAQRSMPSFNMPSSSSSFSMPNVSMPSLPNIKF